MLKPNIFILESLSFKDEKKKQFEGDIISQILHLGNRRSSYYYFRTQSELEELLKKFERSKFRYLHISSHGSFDELNTTLDDIKISDFVELSKDYLRKKRLFFSACELVNDEFAKTLFSETDCLSLAGPDTKIAFDDAAIAWASFYHLVFGLDSDKMSGEAIRRSLQKVVNTFGHPLNYYARNSSKKWDYNPYKLTPEEQD